MQAHPVTITLKAATGNELCLHKPLRGIMFSLDIYIVPFSAKQYTVEESNNKRQYMTVMHTIAPTVTQIYMPIFVMSFMLGTKTTICIQFCYTFCVLISI